MGCVPSVRLYASAVFLLAPSTVQAQPPENVPPQPDESGLAREVQNPVSKLSSVPVRYQTDFGIGPQGLARNTLSIRPTIAGSVTPDLSIVSRTTVPFVFQPDPAHGFATISGLGDIAESLYVVPSLASEVIWGVGPTVSLPTASEPELGSGQLGLGPTAAVLIQPRPLTLGVLAAQIWSVEGASTLPSVNRLSVMYVGAFHFPHGWYVHTAPIVTANWNAGSLRNTWTIPVGGGAGKVLNVGGVSISASVAAYWNVVRPDTVTAPSASAQVQVALLLPR
jgi:hypothetical protein